MTAWIYKTVGSIGKWMVNLWQNSQPGLRAIAEAFKPIIDVVRNLWYKVLLPLWDGVLEPLLGWLTGQAGRLSRTSSRTSGRRSGPDGRPFKMAFEHGWKTLFGGLFDWLAEKWGWFLDLLKKIGQAFGLVSSDPCPSTASSGGNAQSPPRLSGKLEVPRVPPLDPAKAS
ncbi:hypothetical protein U1Q18_052061 [Sarracenia purpurea var. burkii]